MRIGIIKINNTNTFLSCIEYKEFVSSYSYAIIKNFPYFIFVDSVNNKFDEELIGEAYQDVKKIMDDNEHTAVSESEVSALVKVYKEQEMNFYYSTAVRRISIINKAVIEEIMKRRNLPNLTMDYNDIVSAMDLSEVIKPKEPSADKIDVDAFLREVFGDS